MGEFTIADEVDDVSQDEVTLTDGALGYSIRVRGEHVGSMEAIPGRLEYIEVATHWQGKGVARAALIEFIDLSREHGESEVTTNNATHPAMNHILETEDFEERSAGIGWTKQV